MKNLTYYLKNIFFILLFLQFLPILIGGIKKQYSNILKDKTKVGKLKINGTITCSEKYIENIKNLIEEKKVKALLLKIDSPGGSAGPAYALYHEIIKLKEKYPNIPIISLTEGICASGGYYVACAADYLIASRTALVGSIGAYIAIPELSEFAKNIKINYSIIKAGKLKAAGNPFKNLTEDEKTYFQELANDIHKQFIKDVLERRPKITTDITEIAQGQVFTGNQALELGLIDKVGSLETAINIIKEKASIDNHIEWIEITDKKSLWDIIFGAKIKNINNFFNKALSYITQNSNNIIANF